MSNGANLNWIAGAIWSIADDVLRDVYVRGKYRAHDGAAPPGRGAGTHQTGGAEHESISGRT